VTGIASIERISPAPVRITKYMHRKDRDMVTHREVWDWQLFLRSLAPCEEAVRILERMGTSTLLNDDRRREAH
jgi:hypothetical protein